MTGDPVLAFRGVTRTFGTVTAVEDLTFDVRAGRVVGLLGRNGAGKTTALRILLGLSRPTGGTATVLGCRYDALPDAHRTVGVAMEEIGAFPGVTGLRDLEIWARTLGVGRSRVSAVIELVGLGGSERKRLAAYSQGMRQRHALAVALLADPQILVLDEPANGLDPEGIRWLRRLLRDLAAEGRTVLLSSHQLAEVEQTVDDVVVLERTLRYVGPLAEFTDGGTARLEDRFFDLVDGGDRSRGRAHERETL